MADGDNDTTDDEQESSLFSSAVDMVLEGVGTALAALFDGV